MLTSLALIFLVGLSLATICQRLKLPGIIGMLATGIILGPFVLDFLDPSVLSISADLREIALIIILLKAGLSLDFCFFPYDVCDLSYSVLSSSLLNATSMQPI